MKRFQVSEGTAAQRRMPIHLVDATDGLTAETGEAGGQSQISKNGASFTNTSAVLVAIGNGAYYVELTAAELDTLGFGILRYKSANTAEAQVAFEVVAYDPFDATSLGLTRLDAAVTTRSSLTSANVETAVAAQLNTAVPGSPVADSLYERVKTLDDSYTAARAVKVDNLDAAVTTRASPAQVNTEVCDVLKTDTKAEPGVGAPPATDTIENKIAFIHAAIRNRMTCSLTERKLYADDAVTVITKGTISDSGTLYDRGELGAP